jgi:hypothetical protein
MPIITGITHVASFGILSLGKLISTGTPMWRKTKTHWVDK